MPQIKRTGVPTRKTAGAIGDIYTDISTGKQYECIFAYRDNADSDFDCQWSELKTEKIPSGKIQEKQPEKVVEEVKEEVKKPTSKNFNRNRTNYVNYSR